MKKITLILLAVLFVTGIYSIESCESSKASASKMMKFNLEKGKGYDYEMLWDFNQEVMNQVFGISMTADYSVDVADDDGNTKTLSAMYKDFKMNMKIMGKEIDIDTQKPLPQMSMDDMKQDPQALMNKLFGTIVGKKFAMKVDKDGKVLEVTGVENLFAAMADSMGLDADSKTKLSETLKDKINSDEIKDQFAEVFYIFPNKEVKVGDSWTKTHEKGGKTPAKYITTYKVKEIEGEMVTLSAESTIESAQESFKVDGTQKGTLIVDSKIGLVVNADFTQDMTISASGLAFTLKGKSKIKGTAR